MVGVNKVEPWLDHITSIQTRMLPDIDGIPTHVRQFVMDHFFKAKRYTTGPARHEAEPSQAALLASLGQQLHAETNAENGNSPLGSSINQRFYQPQSLKTPHAGIEGTNTGQDDPLGAFDASRISRGHGLHTQYAEHVDNGCHIPQAGVDYCHPINL
jgi:hypothetical protein